MTPGEFPAVGSTMTAAIMVFNEIDRQLWLGIKPIRIGRAKGTREQRALLDMLCRSKMTSKHIPVACPRVP